MTKEQLWQATLGELELALSKANFTTWFKNTFILSNEEGLVIIAVPNTFTKAWLENKYHKDIITALKNVTQNHIQSVSYKVETKKSASKKPVGAIMSKKGNATTAPEVKRTTSALNSLNIKYVFDTFVVGKGNDLAKAACQAVAEKPGLVYNPLFLYGGSGMGKTHLMQAIGNRILSFFPNKNIIYVTCEKFTNDFIQSVSKGSTEIFKNKYRSADVLLIDDIHFLASKERTQEEFFHTFNTLHNLNKQIVISSDRPPKAISALENRLVSRFEWGMIADITSPDLETRMAILSMKCKEKNYDCSPEIINYIASAIQSNVRELEGALNKLIAHHELANKAPSLETVKDLLSSYTKSAKKGTLTPKQIINIVASFYEISIDDLMGNSRRKELVVPRQISMYLMREEIKSSYPNIGNHLGGRDHTTAMHAYMKISREIDGNEKISQEIILLKQRLYA